MSTMYSRSRRRAGMTLIEILVVIAIIAILAALIVVGVMGAFGRGYEAQARSEISNLAVALQTFKGKYGFYPPDQLKLHASSAQYNKNNALDVQSELYLARMFPNLTPFVNIKWAGATPMPANGYILEGDQCLVFFLGGPPVGGGQTALLGGFSVNPQDPVSLGSTLDRKSYYKFPNGKLAFRVANNPFPSYQDAWPAQPPTRPASPYFYFSSNNKANGYATKHLSTGVGPPPNSLGITPYFDATGNFYNKDTFQIISAGANGKFGPGGLWPSSAGVGVDDFSNFSSAQLGAGVTN